MAVSCVLSIFVDSALASDGSTTLEFWRKEDQQPSSPKDDDVVSQAVGESAV